MIADLDELELGAFEVFTRARIQERSGTTCHTPYVGILHRLDGEQFEVGFTSLFDIGAFVEASNPSEVSVFCGCDESGPDLLDAIKAAEHGGLH